MRLASTVLSTLPILATTVRRPPHHGDAQQALDVGAEANGSSGTPPCGPGQSSQARGPITHCVGQHVWLVCDMVVSGAATAHSAGRGSSG